MNAAASPPPRPSSWWWRRRLARIAGGVVGLSVMVAAVGWAGVRPSNDRFWEPDQRKLATVEVTDRTVGIRDVRDFRYDLDGTIEPGWYDRTYKLDEIESVWLVVVPFGTEWRGPAHIFLSFGFRDSTYVSVSVEARRETGESYSMWGGMFKRYELIYVIGDERDLIYKRAVVAGDETFVYPIRAPRKTIEALFVEMVERADRLRTRPEFYHTLTHNCTTTILDHVNKLATRRIPYGPRILLPGYSDEVALEYGLIDFDGSIAEARAAFRVNDAAARFADAPDFSTRIRQ